MGLMDGMLQQGAMPQQGGLFGSFQPENAQLGMGGSPQKQAPKYDGLQLAMQLSANPTPQMAQQIIQQLHQSGAPEAAQLEEILSGVGGDSAKIKQIADAVVEHLSKQ